jgi:hypothetical protein
MYHTDCIIESYAYTVVILALYRYIQSEDTVPIPCSPLKT